MLRNSLAAVAALALVAGSAGVRANPPAAADPFDAPLTRLDITDGDSGAQTDQVWFHHRHYGGYYGGYGGYYGYRPYYGYASYYNYRPYYGYASYGYYGGYYPSYSYGYSYGYYPSYGYSYYNYRPYYGGYWGCDLKDDVAATRLGDLPTVPPVPPAESDAQANAGQTFQYDGDPVQRTPAPQAPPRPAAPRSTPQSDGVLVSYPAYGQASAPAQQPRNDFAFPAYGERAGGPSGFGVDR